MARRALSTDLSPYTETIFLPYKDKFRADEVPLVKVSVEGVDIDMPVDTGSTALAIGAPLLPSVPGHVGEPAHHYFSSSNVLYNGRLVELDITFHGLNGEHAVARVPVLVVDKSWVCPWYDPWSDTFDCPLGPDGEQAKERPTSKITYMGVGFGRNGRGYGKPFGMPRGNAFLNIDQINGIEIPKGALRTGYVITREGVHLGLTNPNTRGFRWMKLEPGETHDTDNRDWAMANMHFSVHGQTETLGSVLIDTGIQQMYIRAKDGHLAIPQVTIPNPNPKKNAKYVQRVTNGTRIDVGFPDFGHESIARYSFEVGEGSAWEPGWVVPEKPHYPPFVNTGRNFFFSGSIAFDAVNGRFGLRPAPLPSPSSL